jgi:branched-chain amino acid transport system ATP-binding protein
MNVLDLNGFSVMRGGVTVVHDLSLSLTPGQSLAVLGDNGAGKSSLLAGIMGLTPSSGSIRLFGDDIGGLPTHRRVTLGLGYCPDHRGLFPALTPRETLMTACPAASQRDQYVSTWLSRFPELERRADAPSWQLSGGEQQMLSLARAMIGQPRLLLLDEPSLGLAPALRERLGGLLATIARDGVSLLLVEQDAHFAESLCSTSIFLDRGILVRRVAT